MIDLKTRKISFQGALGANSDMACRAVYPDLIPVPCETFEDAFDALAQGHVDLAMIPIENNQAGRVADIHTLLPTSDVHIIAEHYQPVQHNLLACQGTNLSDVTEVHSHVMALAQCRKRLTEMGAKHVVTADTAGAARDLAAQCQAHVGQPHVAAIASELAADIYGLDVLETNIEDEKHNTTRFVILSREDVWAPVTEPCMTTVIFQLSSIPAALYKCLGGFATNGISLTKLESYVFGPQFSAAQFYMDFEGHPKEEAVARALDELKYFTTELKIIGVYPKAKFRQS